MCWIVTLSASWTSPGVTPSGHGQPGSSLRRDTFITCYRKETFHFGHTGLSPYVAITNIRDYEVHDQIGVSVTPFLLVRTFWKIFWVPGHHKVKGTTTDSHVGFYMSPWMGDSILEGGKYSRPQNLSPSKGQTCPTWTKLLTSHWGLYCSVKLCIWPTAHFYIIKRKAIFEKIKYKPSKKLA